MRLLREGINVLLVLMLGYISIVGLLFGPSYIENIHRRYIRYQSKDIVTLLNEEGGGGTGFVVKIKDNTYILTNRHICKSSSNKVLKAVYRDDTYFVEILKLYQDNDLCLVKAPNTAISYLKLARSMELGERAFAVGHPLLEPITVTDGELSSDLLITMPIGQNMSPKDCSGHGMRLIDLSNNFVAAIFGVFNQCVQDYEAQSSTISIQPGNSGSPILNIWGNVIGVAFASNEAGSHSYVVPLSVVKEFLNNL